jgi:ABC-type thiamine transport system ATPase subunit
MQMFSYLMATGITTGAFYALVALGIVIVFKSTEVVNLAHGELFMMGGFLAYTMYVMFGVPYIPSLLLAIAGAFAIGLLTERIAYRPVLKQRRSSRAGVLSGGEQTQVLIGRALMSRPRLLLMDEPSVGLAPRIVETVIETILKLRERGLTILLVEQNVGVAAAVAERAHVLKDGVIAYSGAARDLVNNPEVLASYLGR